ncbi:MAG TPA: M20/M25/M40 family metallo-hydrolase [Pyrinomonadaceae bacterium]|nr:M20/M25/M40 family metallo-hydrolase [Pyrinomonadaceae bacterium]
MKPQRFLQICVLLLVTVTAVAQTTTPAPSQDGPSASKLQQHVSYLASDALDGRRTGTAGATDAARYIAGEFARLGLKPATAGPATRRPSQIMPRYLQSFPYVAGVELGPKNELLIGPTSQRLAVREEWTPLGFSTNATVSGSLVFVGYGIKAADLNHDDYQKLPVSGNIALALSGTPDGENPHGRFFRYVDVRWKAIAARDAGAKALLVIADESEFKKDQLARLAYDNMAGELGLPVVAISQQALNKIAPELDHSELQKLAAAKEQLTVKPIAGPFTLTTDVTRKEVPAYNVIGILEGSDPSLKKETIVIGAHYDHLGRGGDGSLAPRSGEIHHGADDNASGTAGVLELARVFTSQRPRPKRTIVFIGFGGEEEGLLGSKYYVANPVTPLANTVAMINMDMIGRMKDRKLVIGGVGTAKEWREIIAQGTADPARSFDLTLNEDGFGPSDHSSFYGKQIPVLFFWTGTHADYHKPSDTFEKINYTDQTRILNLVGYIVRNLDVAPQRITYLTAKTEATPRTGGFRVYLGTIPNYADSNNGLLIDGVREDSPAAKAGLKAGDRIVKIGAREVKNVYDYTFALGEMKADEEYVIEVIRGTDRLTLKITPVKR